MADDDTFKQEKLGEAVAVGAVTLVAAATGNPAAAIVAPIVAPLGAIAGHAVARRFSAFSRGARSIDSSAVSDEDVIERLQAAQDESTEDTVLEAFRRLRDTLDDGSAFFIGRLTMQYQVTHRKPDRFFRALGGFLAESNGEEIALLCRVLLAARRSGPDSVSVTLARAPVPDGGFTVHFVADGGRDGELAVEGDPRELFAALQRHGLAVPADHSPTGTQGETVELTLGQVIRLLEVLHV